MTVIVAYSRGHDMSMGSDSALINGWEISQSSSPKVFRRSTGKGDYLVGLSGSYRAMNLLEFMPRVDSPIDDAREFAILAFVPAWRVCLEAGGALSGEDMESELVIAYNGDIVHVDSKFSVAWRSGYWAIGVGAPYAMGAVWSNIPHPDTSKVVDAALRVACKFSMGRKEPLHIETVKLFSHYGEDGSCQYRSYPPSQT